MELKNEFKSRSNGSQEFRRTTNQFVENLEDKNALMSQIQNIHDKMAAPIKTERGRLPDKHFIIRNSLLSDLANVPHLRTMRSVFIVVLISLFGNAVMKDVVKNGKITLGFEKIVEGTHNLHIGLFIWLCMLISTVGVYGSYLFWGTFRIGLLNKPRSVYIKLWDGFWVSSFFIYIIGFLCIAINTIITNSLQIMLSKILITEAIRLFMKTYAFVRSNVQRVLKYKVNDEDQIVYPTFSQFLYFLFAPTLIYSDSYPRTTHIRWNSVTSWCIQFFAGCLCLHLIQEYIVVYSFENYDLKNIKLLDILLLVSGNAIPSMFYFICWLFIICHASQNIFAEVLRFGDRLFYKDWWNARSVKEIITRWNVAVHDWFYFYIYKDIYEIVLPKNDTAAKLVKYSIMFIFHELIYGLPYGFYYLPMLFIYMIGIPLLSLLNDKNELLVNSLILFCLTNGMGHLRTGLMLDYYARIKYPVENATVANYFIPRWYTCNLY